MRSAAPLVLLALASCADPPTPAIHSAAIVGGSIDRNDSAVGAVLIQDSRGTTFGLCTGTLISKRVVMTAAHCVDIDEPDLGPLSPRQVFFGTQLKEAGAIGTFNVVRSTIHPTYNSARIEGGGDIALLLLDRAPPVTPIALNRTRLEGRQGESVRIVGFGITSGGGKDDGIKRETTTTLDQIDSKLLWFFSSNRNTCNGDSGGPTFVRAGDREVVAGVTSFGDEDCLREGANSRVDIYAATFIDPWVSANDPAGDPPPPIGTCAGADCDGDEMGGGSAKPGEEEVVGGCAVGRLPHGVAGALLVALALLLAQRLGKIP